MRSMALFVTLMSCSVHGRRVQTIAGTIDSRAHEKKRQTQKATAKVSRRLAAIEQPLLQRQLGVAPALRTLTELLCDFSDPLAAWRPGSGCISDLGSSPSSRATLRSAVVMQKRKVFRTEEGQSLSTFTGQGKRASRRWRHVRKDLEREFGHVDDAHTVEKELKKRAQFAEAAAMSQESAPHWLQDSDSAQGVAKFFVRMKEPWNLMKMYDLACNGMGNLEVGEVLQIVVNGYIRMKRTDLALKVYHQHVAGRPREYDPKSARQVFFALCREGSLDEARKILDKVLSEYPRPNVSSAELAELLGSLHMEDKPMWYSSRAVLAPTLAKSHLAVEKMTAEHVEAAMTLVGLMEENDGLFVPKLGLLTQLIRGFGKVRCLRGVYACIDAQIAGKVEPDGDSNQALVQALSRSSRFVTGGVSMESLPQDENIPEVAFMGRSNVGKSSMVNMVLGRKALAYTSKKPGKTQEYNYFILNEPTGTRKTTLGMFHLVDMPGLGYAEVPGANRKQWLKFMRQYAKERQQLKVLVHLIDGVVGVQKTDVRIMEMVSDAHREADVSWDYVIALTKADKERARRKHSAQVELEIADAIAETGCPKPAAIIQTSATTKRGRFEMWQMLRGVVLPEKQTS